MKNFIKNKLFFLSIILVCFICTGFITADTQTEVTMYSLDGRELTVKETEIQLYENVGWYQEPVIVMYSLDNRTLIVKKSEIQLYESVGWYQEPVVIMYSADNRSLIVKQREIQLYQNVGWFLTQEEARISSINEKEVELLARIIHAEAADNNYIDRCYVGMVVMNRKNTGIYRNTNCFFR